MKVLEVNTLHAGINQVLSNVRNQREQLKQIERSIQAIVDLQDSFKGEGGQAIRGFFQSYHLSFLQDLLSFYNRYIETLEQIQNNLTALEPASEGFIRESFLEHEVFNGLETIKERTVSLIDETNQVIGSVADIVALPKLDDAYVLQGIKIADQQRDETIGKLHTFDQQQVAALLPLENTVQAMVQYVQHVSTLFQARNGSIPSIESIYYSQNLLQPNLSLFAYSKATLNKLSAWNHFYLNYLKSNPNLEVKQLISTREAEALIRQSLDQVQVVDEFSTDTSKISGTYYLLPDGRILRKYHELNASEASYAFVDYIPENRIGGLEEEVSFFAWMKGFGKTSVDIAKGTGTGLYEVGKDLVTGFFDMVTNPVDTIKSTFEAVSNPGQTFRAIESAISESYERDVINGDAYSRANWFSYATGTVVTSVVGTKGLGAVGKTGVATTKSAAQTGISATKNAFQSSSIANLLPYTPRPQLSMSGGVPFNTLNGVELKNQLISMAKVESVGRGNSKPLQNHHYATNKSKKYTPQIKSITQKYNLDLDDAWNKEYLPHQGRHPNAYHDYVLDNLRTFDSLAKGDRDKFLKMFDGLKSEIRSNPDMLYKDYWRLK